MNRKYLTMALIACVGMLCAGAAQNSEQDGEPNSDVDSGAAVLKRFDKDGNGFLEQSEMPPGLSRRLEQLDRNSDGVLDAKEFGPVAERMGRSGKDRAGAGGAGGSRRSGEINAPPAQGERPEERLKVGDDAPDFTLPLASGDGAIRLSEFESKKPVVLVFGSLTCPPFRSRMLEFDPIYRKYKDEVEFLMVYTREAHPESTIYIEQNGEEILRKIEQTDDMDQRMEHAQVCGPTLKFTFPTVVDKVDNAVNKAYAGWPSRFVVVGADGKIVYDGGPGPGGFQPAELDNWLASQRR